MVFWVFGYGSLIWKPPPHAIDKKSGYVKGVVRRFAQSSIDHRGVPERPGRVVTLVKADEWRTVQKHDPYMDEDGKDVVWGVAWLIDPEVEAEVREHLDFREKNGYTAHEEPVYHLEDGEETVAVERATIYIGRLDNPAFVGYEPVEDTAKRILSCKGPSGPNREYLYELAAAVRELYPSVEDRYLFELDRMTKEMESLETMA